MSLLLQAHNFNIQHSLGDKNPADSRRRETHPESEPSSELLERLYF